MCNSKKPSKKFLIGMSILFGIQVVYFSFQVITTPYTFVRVINVLGIISLSLIIGAFIREVFLLSKKENMNKFT